MGMNTILMLMAGIVMTTMIGSTIAPSIIEGTKVTKVQTQTINNQEVIFEAIKRYVTIKQVAPTTMAQLISAGYIDAKVNDNGFGGTYTFSVSTTTGVATITTTIVDPKAQEMFLNSFMGTSKPTKVGATNNFETKYVIPNEVMHGNALLMTGVPIQNTAPDSSIYKYWYDTSSGKAVLKLHNGTSWIVVDFGAANVKVTDNQTIAGTKTFSSNIIGNITGNAGSVTNGVYTTGNQTINGVKTFSSNIVGNITGSAGSAGSVTNGVYTTGNQTIAGIKTFSSSPIVPTPTTNTQAANKQYVDSQIAGGGGGGAQTFAPGNYNLIIPGNFYVGARGNIKTLGRLITRSGTLRVSFTLNSIDANVDVYARIYLNGVAKGTNRSAKLSPITFTEDIVVNVGDVIELSVSAAFVSGAQISNFRIMSSKETIFPLGL